MYLIFGITFLRGIIDPPYFPAPAVFLDFRDVLAVSELEIVGSNEFGYGIIIIAHGYEYAQQRMHLSA